MFGFLKPLRPSRVWSQSYARVCQFQRSLFGISSLPFLSYEAAFLYQLAIDLSLNDRLPEDSVTCCRFRKLKPVDCSDRSSGEFAAAFGLYLFGVKLQDDLVDSNRWYNKVLWAFYRERVRRAEGILETRSPGLVTQLAACIARYSALQNQHPHPSLEELMEIAGDGFHKVFRASADLTSARCDGESHSTFRQRMEAVGRHVGRAIIAWDCAVDFAFDRLQKQFTPLTSLSDVTVALEICERELACAARLCPEGSTCQEILENTQRRVNSRRIGSGRPSRVSRLERWGLLRQRGSVYARCEFPCCCVVADAATCCITSHDSGCCHDKEEPPRPDHSKKTDRDQSITSDVNLLRDINNCQIVQVVGRTYPGVVFQGDTLSCLVDLASDVVRLLNEGEIDEAKDSAREIHDLLAARLIVLNEMINRSGET